VNDVGSVKYKVELDDSGIDQEVDKAESKLSSKFGSAAKGIAAGVGKAAIGAVAAGTAAVGAFAKASVDAGMTFDSSMSQVAATMGKTVDEIADLRDFAQEMGSKTAFSATEAADALNYMALAGYDAETAMNMLPNVLNLAAAGGIELASASDMVTDAQSALGLSLEETAAMVDQMAAASSKSNTSVEQLGNAILTVGGTAKTLKGGTTELATVLGLLADNGVKGAEGGTALRNIMLSLQNPTDKAAEALKALGVEAYDSQGNFRAMEDIFQDFNKALDGASDAKRSEALSAIFNKVDLKSVNALMDTNVERWHELAGAIDSSQGAAEKMASTQLDNLAGDITLLQSALEGAKIAVSDGLTPQLREFVEFGTDGLSKVTEAFNTDGVSGAMDALGGILADAVVMIGEKATEMVDVGIKLISSFCEGLISAIPDLLPIVTDLILRLAQMFIDMAPELVRVGLDLIVQLALGIAQALPELIPAVVDCILEIVDVLTDPDNLMMLIDASIAIIIAIAEGLIEALPKLIEKAPVIIEHLVTALIKAAPKLAMAAAELIVTLVKCLFDNLPKILDSGGKIVTTLIRGIRDYFSQLPEIGKQVVQKVKDGIKSLNPLQWGRDLIDSFVQGITGAVGKVWDAVKGIASGIRDFLGFSEPEKGPLSDFHLFPKDMVDLYAQGIEDNAYKVTDAVEGLAGDVALGFNSDINYNLPDLAGYAADLSASITGTGSTRIEVPVIIDGREVARASAWYMGEQLAWEAR